MFKHILVATDGSKLAAKGVRAGVALAKDIGARVTGIYIIAPYTPPVHAEGTTYFAGVAPRDYRKHSEREAKKALATVQIEAQAARVPCATKFLIDARPWEGIVRAARAGKCDLIAMASHGRSALGGLLLGSETQRVLAHSKIPVLVAR